MNTSIACRLAGLSVALGGACTALAQSDPVLFWNTTMRRVIQQNGGTILPMPTTHGPNPGWSTRSIAITNGAIYDVFQAFNRTHAPLLVTSSAPSGASLDAAIAQAAYVVLADCYPDQAATLEAARSARLDAIADGPAKDDGIAFGSLVAAKHIGNRTDDGAEELGLWLNSTEIGEWRADPLHPAQSAWGPSWGTVKPFVLPSSSHIGVPGPPPLDSQAYTDAFNQVKEWGALESASRSADQENIGLFWAYDRPTMGPPPVLFVRNLEDIAAAVGTAPADNARLFALASTAMADAAIAAWDVKFDAKLWRPITAIREGDYDSNDDTVGDSSWVPLGAPGGNPFDPNDLNEDDFTPPFPAYTSGHATMGGAVFKAVELFFATNSFAEADARIGNDPIDAQYQLYSEEFNATGIAGFGRTYDRFVQVYDQDLNHDGRLDDVWDTLTGLGQENSPEGENATSRIYLGIHWIFDQRDGTYLGNDIARFVFANRFQSVPEPTTGLLLLSAATIIATPRRRLGSRTRVRPQLPLTRRSSTCSSSHRCAEET